jgi:hypothetical protein
MSDLNSSEEPEKNGEEVKQNRVSFATFLEEYPVNTRQAVSNYYSQLKDTSKLRKSTPILRIFCNDCGGMRNFEGEWAHHSVLDKSLPPTDFLVYICRDCKKFEKFYSLFSRATDEEGNGEAIKLGEHPELNIDLPSILPTLFGQDYPYFIKGLKTEKQGFGVAAYTYYRRVVENQKNRLLDEILKVAKKVGASSEVINNLENAIAESQFAKAIDITKDTFPESLLIDGHNPLKLLHKALSIGIHKETDERCLQLAHDIRIVLTDLSTRIKVAMSERKELKTALLSLTEFNKERGS